MERLTASRGRFVVCREPVGDGGDDPLRRNGRRRCWRNDAACIVVYIIKPEVVAFIVVFTRCELAFAGRAPLPVLVLYCMEVLFHDWC